MAKKKAAGPAAVKGYQTSLCYQERPAQEPNIPLIHDRVCREWAPSTDRCFAKRADFLIRPVRERSPGEENRGDFKERACARQFAWSSMVSA